jgi:hypothetical protein
MKTWRVWMEKNEAVNKSRLGVGGSLDGDVMTSEWWKFD